MSNEPEISESARKALDAAGYGQSDPDCRGLVALVDLAFRSSQLGMAMFPSKKAHNQHTAKRHRQLVTIRRLLIEAKRAGVTDKHLATVPMAPADRRGKRAWGELLFDATGWRYVPPGKGVMEIHTTHRLAVISCLRSAIWAADIEGRKVRGRRRVPILTTQP